MNLPDPEKRARKAREWNEGHGIGVLRDSLMDARIEAKATAAQLSNMYVHLDGMADDLGLAPRPVGTELRKVQGRIKELHEWYEEFNEAIEAELNDINS